MSAVAIVVLIPMPNLLAVATIAACCNKNQENRSHHLTGTQTYVSMYYDTFLTTSLFHHDMTETNNYGNQQHNYQNSYSERSSTTVYII